MFDGIEKKVASKHLKKYMGDLASGTTGNPLYSHFTSGQMDWQDNAPEYAKAKRKKFGATEQFVRTGAAKKAIKGRPGKTKKVKVSYRKKGDYFLMTAGLRKIVEGKNVYTIAQRGRFAGIAYTSGGKSKSVSSHDYNKASKQAGTDYAANKGKGVDTKGVSKGKYKASALADKFGIDKGSAKRQSKTPRMISSNLPGDGKFIKDSQMKPVLKKIIEESGYKLS